MIDNGLFQLVKEIKFFQTEQLRSAYSKPIFNATATTLADMLLRLR